MRTHRWIVAIALLAGLGVAACGKDSTDPSAARTGIHATLSGAVSGSFDAVGAFPTSPSVENVNFAAAASSDGLTGIEGMQYTDGKSAVLGFFVFASTPGTYPVDPNCYVSASDCAIGEFATQATLSPSADAAYELTSGTVTLTEITSTRIRGTFEVVATGGASGSAKVTLSNGTIDVPRTSNVTSNLLLVPVMYLAPPRPAAR